MEEHAQDKGKTSGHPDYWAIVCAKWSQCVKFHREEKGSTAPKWRWLMLAILSWDICVSYIPYYTFVPIPRQSMQVYGVDEAALNVLCILYALVYVPAAFVTGPIVATLGCRWTFVLAMALTTLGCAVRCSMGMHILSQMILVPIAAVGTSTSPAAIALTSDPSIEVPFSALPIPAASAVNSFWWLVIGQALCALGQPLLVNTTSEMGAEWFPPNERPTAAMVSNLMNFIGSSLSFILPPLVVKESHLSLQDAEQEIDFLLKVQLWLAMASLIVTLLLYQPAPLGKAISAPREAATCVTDIICIAKSRDFWLVNGYFTIYIALCHAFDAVEGSLLEHYGYNASLTSWTAVSCGIASILSTLLEARCITSATAYRGALLGAAGFLAASQMLGFVCLFFRMHGGVFVFAVGIMGLATPGWGCSCELGAEVCYPAREATVSSILEAFSNLGGVFSIIATQRLIDAGYGAGVLGMLAGAAACSGLLLICLRGRLFRSEAEAAEGEVDDEEQVGLQLQPHTNPDTSKPPPDVEEWWLLWQKGGRRTQALAISAVCIFLLFCRVLLFLPQSQLPEELLATVDAPQTIPLTFSPTIVVSKDVKHKHHGKGKHNHGVAKGLGALGEVHNFLVSCQHKEGAQKRRARFQKLMNKTGLKFEVFPCVPGTMENVNAAVRDGLIGPKALHAYNGFTAQGKKRADIWGSAISHLRLLRKIAGRKNMSIVNIFEDSEAILPNYRERRTELLANLPNDLDIVKLDVKRPAGRKVNFVHAGRWLHVSVFRMHSSLSPTLNLGMNNYVVTKNGAAKILNWSQSFEAEGRWETWDQHLLVQFYRESKNRANFVGFTVSTSVLSVICHAKDHNRPQVEACKM